MHYSCNWTVIYINLIQLLNSFQKTYIGLSLIPEMLTKKEVIIKLYVLNTYNDLSEETKLPCHLCFEYLDYPPLLPLPVTCQMNIVSKHAATMLLYQTYDWFSAKVMIILILVLVDTLTGSRRYIVAGYFP